jgi:Tol biopolymer transport system component
MQMPTERLTQVTRFSTEAGGVLFSPDGKNLVFTSEVYRLPRRRLQQNQNRRRAKNPVSPNLYVALPEAIRQGKRRNNICW